MFTEKSANAAAVLQLNLAYSPGYLNAGAKGRR
jgi:hypothetical protein